MNNKEKEITVESHPVMKEGTNIEGYFLGITEEWGDGTYDYTYTEWWSIYSDGTFDYFEYDSEYDKQIWYKGIFDPLKYDTYATEMKDLDTSWKKDLTEIIIKGKDGDR